MTHSIIAPSSAGIWGKPDGCLGSVLMSQIYPGENSKDSLEGEASHEIGFELIELARRAKRVDWAHFDGRFATNGELFTENMFDAAEQYADDVVIVMREAGVFGGDNMGTEDRVEAFHLHPLLFGTVDCWLFDRRTGTLYVWDYKYGMRVVDAFECWQLICYVAGLLIRLGLVQHDENITVKMRVIQPRAFNRGGTLREWTVRACDLRGHFNVLSTNAHKALGPDAPCTSGSHCRDCPARHACEAALTAGVGLYEAVSQPIPSGLSPQALGVQLKLVQRAIHQLEYLETAYKVQAEEALRQGQPVANYSMVESFGRLKWSKPFVEVKQMGELCGHDLQEQKAITPTKAKALGIDPAVIKAYSFTPSAGLKLIQENVNKAKQVFSK